MKIRFLRTGTSRFKRLGKGRKKLMRWRRARGRHNKIREGKKSTRRKVEVGFRRKRGKKIILVRNLKETARLEKGDLVVIGKVGRKKRIELERKVEEKEGRILNKIKERK